MRAFAAAWPEPEIVQRGVAQLPWRQNIALLERLDDRETRLWYAEQTIRNGWSQPILCMQIDSRLHERQGKALPNFEASLAYEMLDFLGPDAREGLTALQEKRRPDFHGAADGGAA